MAGAPKGRRGAALESGCLPRRECPFLLTWWEGLAHEWARRVQGETEKSQEKEGAPSPRGATASLSLLCRPQTIRPTPRGSRVFRAPPTAA